MGVDSRQPEPINRRAPLLPAKTNPRPGVSRASRDARLPVACRSARRALTSCSCRSGGPRLIRPSCRCTRAA